MFRLARVQGVRFNSTSAKAAAPANVWVTRTQTLVNGTLYWSKVGLELGKYLWVKEGLSPPSVQQFQKVFTQDFMAGVFRLRDAAKSPQALINQVSSFSREQWIQGSAAFVQLLGLFALGEIIGRRHIYGYKSHEEHH